MLGIVHALSRLSSVVEHFLGKEGVECPIHSGGTTIRNILNLLEKPPETAAIRGEF